MPLLESARSLFWPFDNFFYRNSWRQSFVGAHCLRVTLSKFWFVRMFGQKLNKNLIFCTILLTLHVFLLLFVISERYEIQRKKWFTKMQIDKYFGWVKYFDFALLRLCHFLLLLCKPLMLNYIFRFQIPYSFFTHCLKLFFQFFCSFFLIQHKIVKYAPYFLFDMHSCFTYA